MHVREYLRQAFCFLLHDQVRMIELFSALNLLAWAAMFASQSQVLPQQTFQSLPASTWFTIFVCAAVLQLSGLANWYRKVGEVRFIAMSFATGCWAAITVSFLVDAMSMAVSVNYALLTIATAIAGGFLGWKTSSTRS